MYEDIYDAKTAVEHLSGFNVANRYLIVLYYNHNKHSKKVTILCLAICLLATGYALQSLTTNTANIVAIFDQGLAVAA